MSILKRRRVKLQRFVTPSEENSVLSHMARSLKFLSMCSYYSELIVSFKKGKRSKPCATAMFTYPRANVGEFIGVDAVPRLTHCLYS